MALNKQFTMEQLFIAITVSRLVLTVGLVLSIGGSFVWSGLWLALVIAADIPNGVVARRFGADTPRRRIADSVVDRITIGAACTTFALQRPEVAVALIPLAIRGGIVAIASIACYRLKNGIVTSRQLHKLGSLITGAMGFVLLSGSGIWPVAVWVTTGVSFMLLFAYIPAWWRVLTAPSTEVLQRYYTPY